MIEQDTVKLLRECDAGVKMGISSLEDVLDRVRDPDFRAILKESIEDHKNLEQELRGLLDRCGDEGKDPNPVAKSMSTVKTNVKLAVDSGDDTVADLMTDGCNMGVKSLHRYLNLYRAASENAKNICKKLINLEEKLAVDLRIYL